MGRESDRLGAGGWGGIEGGRKEGTVREKGRQEWRRGARQAGMRGKRDRGGKTRTCRVEKDSHRPRWRKAGTGGTGREQGGE